MTTYAGGGMQNNIPGLLADISLAEAVAVDRNSNVYIASCSLNQVFKLTPSGELFTVAGNGASGFSGDGGPATGAELGGAYFGSCRLAGVAADGSGNVFIADVGNQRIRRVDAATQIITTVAGNGTPGFSGDGGPATSAELNFPGEVAVDSSGDLFIADSRNHRIRRVDAATQVITTVAGNGTKGYSGDGGPATGSELDYPAGVAVDSSGDLFIADTGNERIRRVDAATQVITTFAGNGTEGFGGDGGPATSAQLLTPEGLAMDSSADLFIADVNNERVRRVDATTNIITTVAGNGTVGFSGDGGLATNAELDVPAAVALDGSGDLFIADVDNGRIRYVKSSTQVISTIAGGAGGGDGGPASASVLAWPEGVALDSAGNLFVADFFNWRIRRVDGVTGMITTVAGNGIPCVGYENCGYGGPATSAELFDPGAPAADESGNVFFSVGGFGTPVLRIDATTQVLTVVAGNGNASYRGDGGPATSAGLSACGVAVDGSGDLFFADCQNARIRRVDAVTHIITTVAGNGNQGYSGDGGPATSAELSDPTGVAVDSSGDLFIADSSNCRIRRVDAATQIISTVTTFSELVGVIAVDRVGNLYVSVGSAECLGDGVFFSGVGSSIVRLDAVTGATARVAGTGVYGFSGDGGPATSSEIGSPSGVAVGSTGMLYISDSSNNRVRETTLPPFVALQPTALTFSNQNIGTTSPIQTVKLTNTGLVPLAVSSIDASAGFQETDNCGSSVAANTYCTLEVTFDPTVPGAQTGTITVTDNSFGSPHIISLTGTGTGPVASLPAPPTFPSEPVGTTSPAQTVTLTNTGNANLTFTAIGVTGPFAIAASGTTCSTSSPVAPSGSCSAAITFTPTAVGTNSGSLSFTDNATNSPQTVGLTGTGTGAVVSLPAPPTFPSEPVGTTSPSQTVTVTNTGNANLTFTAIGVSGPFAIAASGTTCSTSSPVAASGSCTVSLTFTPTAVGTASGSLSFTDNGGNSPQTVSLTGTGTGAIVSLSAPPTFPSEPVGTTSPPQTVTVTNTGNASLTFTAISTTGPFAIATSGTTCSTSNPVAASGSCTVALTFTPTTVGTASGSLSFADNAANSPQTVSLSGTGTGPIVSLPAPPTFSPEPVGTTSPPQTVSVTNTGNANLTFTAIGTTGPFAITASGTTCSVSSPVAASGSCTVPITFTPTAGGAASGSLSFTDNAGGSPQTLALSATGQDFSLAVPTGSSSSQTVSPGATATYTVAATSIGGFNQAVSLSCSGAPSEASCQLSQASVTPSSSGANVTVTLTTTAPSASAPRSRHLPRTPPLAPWPGSLAMLALLLAGMAWAIRSWSQPGIGRLRAAFVALALAMLLALAMAACGGGGSSAPSNPGTPPGTYTITVTGSFGSGSSPLTHSVKLTLTVS